MCEGRPSTYSGSAKMSTSHSLMPWASSGASSGLCKANAAATCPSCSNSGCRYCRIQREALLRSLGLPLISPIFIASGLHFFWAGIELNFCGFPPQIDRIRFNKPPRRVRFLFCNIAVEPNCQAGMIHTASVVHLAVLIHKRDQYRLYESRSYKRAEPPLAAADDVTSWLLAKLTYRHSDPGWQSARCLNSNRNSTVMDGRIRGDD